MKLLLFVCLCISHDLYSQKIDSTQGNKWTSGLNWRVLHSQTIDTTQGINWTSCLNWQQVKEKAKLENKSIFLDCYATWCGPCKRMDESVYSKKMVGSFINERFISVRVQFDQTKMDEEHEKIWQQEIESLKKKYKITVFPTYLFFTADGKIVLKDRSFKTINQFIDLAKSALEPGRKYEDPFAEYDAFVVDFFKGKNSYKKMPFMIEKARQAIDNAVLDTLQKVYFNYLKDQKPKTWYSKENIQFVGNYIKESNSVFFPMFYPNGRKVNEIMNIDGFANKVVDKVILFEIVGQFLQKFYAGKTIKQIMSKTHDPNWDSLEAAIAFRYNPDFAKRAVRAGRADYFRLINDMPSYRRNFVEQMNNNDIDMIARSATVNECAWMIFLNSNDEHEINAAIGWMENLVNGKFADNPIYAPLDTYAQLLFKGSMLFGLNRYDEAIAWETKALDDAIKKEMEQMIPLTKELIRKMNERIPTWPTSKHN